MQVKKKGSYFSTAESKTSMNHSPSFIYLIFVPLRLQLYIYKDKVTRKLEGAIPLELAQCVWIVCHDAQGNLNP